MKKKPNLCLLSIVIISSLLLSAAPEEPDSLAELREKAEQGDAKVQHRLGWTYQLGNGVPKDTDEALKWFQRAAEQGLAIAQCDLAGYYLNGRSFDFSSDHIFNGNIGSPDDFAEGMKWFRKAEALEYFKQQGWCGNEPGRMRLMLLMNLVAKNERKMTPDQIAAAQKRIEEMLGESSGK